MKETDFNPALTRELKALKGKGEPEICLGCRLVLNSKLPVSKSVRDVIFQWTLSLSEYTVETQHLLATVFESQRNWEQFPDWRATQMAPAIEVKWLRAQLLFDPAIGLTETDLFRLRQALLAMKPISRKGWEQLVDKTLNHPSQMIYTCVPHMLRVGISASCLSSGFLQDLVREALQKEDLPLVEKTCQLIEDQFSLFPNCPEKELRMLTRKGNGFEALGVKTLALWGPHPLLDEVLKGESWEESSKWEALRAKSKHPDPSSLSNLISFLERYPERAIELSQLLVLHQQNGVFPRKQQLASLFTLFLGGLSIPTPILVSLITHKTAPVILEYPLPEETATRHNWINFWGTYPHPLAEKRFTELLSRNDHPDYLDLILNIVVRRNFTSLEPLLLEKLDLAPYLYLNALKKLGGNKTITFLKRRLSFDDPLPVDLPEYEKEALKVLFLISQDQEELLEYMTRRRVADRGDFLPFILSKNSISGQKIILEELENANLELAATLLKKLEEIGDFDVLSKLVQFTAHEEEEIAQRAGQVCISIVRRSHQAGNIFPRTLLDQSPQLAVKSILSQLVLDNIQQESRTEKLQRYLQFLGTVAHGPTISQYAAQLFSHPDPHVVKFALASFSSTQYSSFSQYFQPFLQPEQDIYTLRQALIGAKASGDSSLEPWVLPFLDHRNMNIKKTAAEFLARHGTQRAVPHLLRWLGIHDNPGFRGILQGALKQILNHELEFVLVNAIEQSDRPSTRTHLTNALLELCGDSLSVDKELDFPSLGTSQAFIEWQKAKKKGASPDTEIQDLVLERRKQFQLLQEHLNEGKLPVEEVVKHSLFNPETSPEVLQDLIPGKLRKLLHSHPKDRGLIGELLAKWDACVTTKEARWVFSSASSLPARAWAVKHLFLEKDAPEATIDHIEKLKGNQPKTEVWARKIQYQTPEAAMQEAKDSWLGLWRTKSVWEAENLSQVGLPEQLMDIFHQLSGPKEAGLSDRLKVILRWLIELNPPSLMDFFRSNWSSLALEIRMNLLSVFSKGQVQALEPEIVTLYTSLSAQKRETLILDLKKTPGLFELRRLAFKDFLKSGKSSFLNFWDQPSNSQFLEWQVKMILDHPEATDFLIQTSTALRVFPDPFLSQFISEIERRGQEEENPLSPWRDFPIGRLWKLIEPFLKEEKWSLLKLLPAHRPVNSNLLALLRQASRNEQVILLEWLSGFPGPLYCPGLEDQLMSFLQKWDSPQLLYALLLKMDLWEGDQSAKFLSRFLGHLENAPSSHQSFLAKQLRDQPDHPLLKQPSFRKLLIQQTGSRAFHPDLISLVIIGTNWSDEQEVHTILGLFSSLISPHQETGLALLDIIIEQLDTLPTPQQLRLLEQIYQDSLCQPKVSLAFARLLLRESLLMEMLSPKVADQFRKQICQEIRIGNFSDEMELKAVLRRLSETPFPELIELLKYFLLESRQKKYKHPAFRLLRNVLSHEDFLELCLKVLTDSSPDLSRVASRSLIYAKHKAVLPYLIEFLSHRQKALRETAKEGLMRFGLPALSPLKKALSRARPDRKQALSSLIKEIEVQEE